MDSEGRVVRLVGGAVATYREIADHFGLVSPEKGRQKAKRAGWPAEPQNHPADPVRVRVPQDAWEGASLSRERAARAHGKGRPLKQEGEPPQTALEPPSLIKELEGEAATLRSALDRERERADRAEAAAAVVPDLRERLGRAEGEAGTLREQARAERDRAEAAEAELDKARLGRAAAEAGMQGLREALAEARRPWWRRALGR